MKRLSSALQQGKQIRVLGVDDAPFDKYHDTQVHLSGIVCSNTRFEGMLWLQVERDGHDATDALINALQNSKFHPQLHAVLIDGIAVGGFNIIDLPRLSLELQLPCIAVMRKLPDLPAIEQALQHFDDYELRRQRIADAGHIHQFADFVFQAAGCDADIAAQVLQQTTDTGKVPEALRLAHLIGAAIKFGESGQRA